MHKALFLVLLLLGTGHRASAQNSGVSRTQAVIAGPLTGQLARTLTDHLSARPGVRVCRVDPVSRNLLLETDERFHMTALAIKRLFQLHGLHLRCYENGPRPNAPFRLLDPRKCSPYEPMR